MRLGYEEERFFNFLHLPLVISDHLCKAYQFLESHFHRPTPFHNVKNFVDIQFFVI